MTDSDVTLVTASIIVTGAPDDLDLAQVDAEVAAQVRPVIRIGRDLTDMVDDAVSSLVHYNGREPRVFRYVDALARVSRVEDEDGRMRSRIKQYDRQTLVGELARAGEWVKTRVVPTDDGGTRRVQSPSIPSAAVVAELHGSADLYTQIPALDQIVGCPVFCRDGLLQTVPGYSAKTRTWFEPTGSVRIPHVPDRPGRGDLRRALELLLDELLQGFPFESDADRAHAVGLALTLITRRLFRGLVPMHGFDAPTEGTGKTLLVEATLLLVSGVRPLLVSAPPSRDDAEWDKRIVSALLSGRQFIVWDNVSQNDALDSASLAKLLTADTYGGRLLGLNKDLELPVRLVSIYTGNNVTLSREMARRVVRTRINAHSEVPSQGREFKHDPLLAWVEENRGDLLWALYVLVRNWLARGGPAFAGEALGSYPEWSRTVGGILQEAGINGFLGNRQDVYDSVSEHGGEDAFFQAWWELKGGLATSTEELGKLMQEHLGLTSKLGYGPPTVEAVGARVRKMLGRVTGAYEVFQASSRPKQYALRPIAIKNAA